MTQFSILPSSYLSITTDIFFVYWVSTSHSSSLYLYHFTYQSNNKIPETSRPQVNVDVVNDQDKGICSKYWKISKLKEYKFYLCYYGEWSNRSTLLFTQLCIFNESCHENIYYFLPSNNNDTTLDFPIILNSSLTLTSHSPLRIRSVSLLV